MTIDFFVEFIVSLTKLMKKWWVLKLHWGGWRKEKRLWRAGMGILLALCKEKNGVALGGLQAWHVDLVFDRKDLKIDKGKEPLERSGKTLMELELERQTKAKLELE